MFNWKKLIGSAVELGVDTLSEVKKKVEQSLDKKQEPEQSLVTEEDILQAIDELPIEYGKKVEQENSLPKDVNYIKTDIAGTFASLEYVFKPDMHGLESIHVDERPYFTIPIGWTYDDSMDIQYWYMTFPLGGTEDEIIEFYSPVKIDEINFPGVE